MKRLLPIDPDLEANYHLQALRGDISGVLQRWSQQSATLREHSDASLDCSYAIGDREKLDIFRCGAADAPLYVFIHGGYWQRLDKSVFSLIAEPFLNAKVDVAIIGYPLCPDVSMTQLVASIRSAIAWLYRNAAAYGINAQRINLSGHSAGGQLSALGLSTRWSDLGDDLPDDLLKSGIPFSGLYQLAPLPHTTIGDALHLTPLEIEEYSPINHLPTSDAPVLLVVGESETSAFITQTDQFAEQWKRPGLVIDKYFEPDADHFDLIDRLADSNSALFRRVVNWLR